MNKIIRQQGLPEKVTIDTSGANTVALDVRQAGTGAAIEIGQIKYLNDLVEQDHRAVKRIVRPMLGFKCCHSARTTLRGIELLHSIKKGRMSMAQAPNLSAAGQFHSLAAS